MMLTTITPSDLHGSLQAPTSKSSMQRACAAALLNHGTTIIRNPGYSNDDKAALEVIRGLGASVTEEQDGSLRIKSSGVNPGRPEVSCGESGLGIRMFAPIIALSTESVTVNGEGSLLSRPMDFFDEIFPQLDIRVISNNGKLPLQIQGPLQPRTIDIDGSLSSQFLTGLLFAYAAAGARDVAIRVNNLKSKPYIDLTLQVMAHFGWQVENRNYSEFYFSGKSGIPSARTQTAQPQAAQSQATQPQVTQPQTTQPQATQDESTGVSHSYTVEGDWSGAAFLLVAGAVAGKITVNGLDVQSTQADKAILQALRDSGASLSIHGASIEIGPAVLAPGSLPGSHGPAASLPVSLGPAAHPTSASLKAFQFDATDCPDLFPPLVALAACCTGTSVIDGVGRLAHKESNRALTLQDEFGKMGVSIELQGDRMLIKGGEGISHATVHSRHDHRIAMACAVAGLRADGPVIIEEAQAINKSYPVFYEHLQQLGAAVNVQAAIGKTL